MDVHPWFCVFPESAILGRVREHPEWLIAGPRGEMVAVANPALPAVRAYEIDLMLEVVRKYGVDWVHLDYVRYPCEPTEPFFSFDRESLRLFKEDTGIDMASVKARDTGNPAWNVWLRWNTDRVTVFVRELRAALGATGRKVRISAAVFPDAVNARVAIGQDWATWGREGLVDMLNPMLYTNDVKLYETLAREAVEYAKGGTLVCPGIGVGTSHNQITPEVLIEEMRISQRPGRGWCRLFLVVEPDAALSRGPQEALARRRSSRGGKGIILADPRGGGGTGRERSLRSDHQHRSGAARRGGAGKYLQKALFEDISQKPGSELLRRASAWCAPQVRSPLRAKPERGFSPGYAFFNLSFSMSSMPW